MSARSILLATALAPSLLFAQGDASYTPPISWTVTAAKADAGSYNLLFKGELQPEFVITSST